MGPNNDKNYEDRGQNDWRMIEWWNKKPYTEKALRTLEKLSNTLRRNSQYGFPFPVTFRAADGLIGVRNMKEVFELVPPYVDFPVMQETPLRPIIAPDMPTLRDFKIRRYEFDHNHSVITGDTKVLVYTEVKEKV
jgi:hypothetical protein